MPLSGTARSCSFTRLTAVARSPAPGSSRTGNVVVNQPTVRDRSTPPARCPATCSSRPWPSSSTSTALPASRHSPTATASPVSSTSLTEPWNAVGTRDSSGAVISGGSETVCVRTVAAVSRASRGLVPSSGSGPSSCASQNGSSAERSTDDSAVAQRRNDVATGTGSSLAASRATSSAMIRHDTPSTTRWWITSSSRSGKRTAHTMRPSRGASRAAARRSSFASSASATITSTVPDGGTSSVHSSVNRARSRSWWSTSRRTTSSASTSDASGSTAAW